MEHELIARAKAGDQDAFARLMEQYQRPIYNLTLRMSGRPEDAEELTQTAFFKAWQGLSRFQEDSSFFTWLYRLATNATIDFLRHEKRRFAVLNAIPLHTEEGNSLELPDLRNAPEDKAMEADLKDSLKAALGTLSHEHREVLLMREVDGLSYQEIADMMDLELGTVKSRIARARLALRKILTENGTYYDSAPSKETKREKEVESR